MNADLAYALELADAADALTLPRFRAADLRVETKPDLTPVTDADRATERMLRERIARDRPGEGVFGEEEGDDGGDVRWIVDPIDGTRNFSRGIPVWATLIALERDGQFVCGVVSAPALGRRWWAARGEGAFANGTPISVSAVATLERRERLVHVRARPRAARAAGLACPRPRRFLAARARRGGSARRRGRRRAALWDYAAIEPIVTEAGGRLGRFGGQIVSTNGLLHDEVLGALSD